MAQRGLRFAGTEAAELRDTLARARLRLNLIQSIDRRPPAGDDEMARLLTLSKEELARLRKEILDLQTDLRAELRRRGEV